jgi:hypothetical protein
MIESPYDTSFAFELREYEYELYSYFAEGFINT